MERFQSLWPSGWSFEAIARVAGLTTNSAVAIVLSICIVVIILLAVRSRFLRRSLLQARKRMERARSVLDTLQLNQGLDNHAGNWLELFGTVVEAPIYAFYVCEPGKKQFVLKAVRHRVRDFGKVRPSYSGLAEFKSQDYHPPLSLKEEVASREVCTTMEGEIPMLSIPIGQMQGIVRIGPFPAKLNKRLRLVLLELGELVGGGLGRVLDTEQRKTQSEVVLASGRAMQQISHIALNQDRTGEWIIRLILQSLGASGGCLVESEEGERFRIMAHIGLSQEAAAELGSDFPTLRLLDDQISGDDLIWVRKGTPAFFQLPAYLIGVAMDALAGVRLSTDGPFLIFWFGTREVPELEIAAGSIVQLVREDVQTIFSLQLALRQMSGTYSGILKGLSRMLDHMSPYTVGYSELMSRYSIMLAKEMGLDEESIRDVALAAYLSNIGMLGISPELYQKEGKYTDTEFEMMKLHAEVGASIVRATLGNDRLADMILYHHERIDGNGYPANLQGEAIPVGARIIAVVQTFMAKINGRKYRDPLPFQGALETLQTAAGTQLDPQMVERFVGWFRRKQRDPRFQVRSLGVCWEMCCAPSSICEHCPVYRRTDVNCWEVEGNRCREHGKSCSTCFVFTEYRDRGSAAAVRT